LAYFKRYSSKEKALRLLVITTFLLLVQVAFSVELTDSDSKVIENYLIEKERELKGGEYKKARKYMEGDLNRDGVSDLAMLYTLEGIGGGGNNYSFFLAVFERTSNGIKFVTDAKVGSKVTRSLNFESIEDGTITFNTKFIWKNDAFCCPSGKGKAYYILKTRQRKLRELNTAPKP
jgi:hypothetical protein